VHHNGFCHSKLHQHELNILRFYPFTRGFPGGGRDRDIWYEKQKQENRNDTKVEKGMRDVEGLAETEIDFGKEFFSYL